jgi:hypothetical protein
MHLYGKILLLNYVVKKLVLEREILDSQKSESYFTLNKDTADAEDDFPSLLRKGALLAIQFKT